MKYLIIHVCSKHLSFIPSGAPLTTFLRYKDDLSWEAGYFRLWVLAEKNPYCEFLKKVQVLMFRFSETASTLPRKCKETSVLVWESKRERESARERERVKGRKEREKSERGHLIITWDYCSNIAALVTRPQIYECGKINKWNVGAGAERISH